MGSTAPVKTACFIKFLRSRGCEPDTGTNHNKWKCKGAFRSIIFDRSTKEIPFFHVKTNLRNMGISMADFKRWAKENC